MKKSVSAVFWVTICIFTCSARAESQSTFMIVPIGCNMTTGDAVASDVLAGKTFSNKHAVGLLGVMPNVGQQIITPTTSNQAITMGYHDGSGMVMGDGDLKSVYILSLLQNDERISIAEDFYIKY